MKVRKYVAMLMLAVLLVQIFASPVYSLSLVASELSGEQSETSNQASEQESETASAQESEVVNEEYQEIDTKKTTRATPDYSGIGPQNTTSDIGMYTYLQPNEQTEDELKTIEQKQAGNSKYISVTDLDADLPQEIVKGFDLSEGILPYEYDSSLSEAEINAQIGASQEFIGSCWQADSDGDANFREVIQKVVETDVCDYKVSNYGSYYNTKTGEFYPVDLYFTVNYLDFWRYRADHPYAELRIGSIPTGLMIKTAYTEEFEYTMKMLDKSGNEVNAPIIFEMTDVDLGSSVGVSAASLHRLATYYQDPNTSPYGTYTPETTPINTLYYGGTAFNYESFYDYAHQLETDGIISHSRETVVTNYDHTFGRGSYRNIGLGGFDKAWGEYTPDERGWNRLKIREHMDI